MKNENYGLFQLFLMSASLNFPLIMLNAPTWLLFLTIFFIFSPIIFVKDWLIYLVLHLYNIVRVILYIWGIIVTAQGQQDFVAIAFYITTGIQAFSMIKNFIYSLWLTIQFIIAMITNKGDDR